jgi:uncharacterized glyoxalase superfamily protein PhnB
MKRPVGHPACADSRASCEPCAETRSQDVEIRSPGAAGRELQKVSRLVSENSGIQGRIRKSQDQTIAIQDQAGFTIFLNQVADRIAGAKCTLVIQVKDVDRKHRELVRKGIKFMNAPQKLMWGYGAELADPDGYQVNLWDKVSMRTKSGS